MKSASIKNFRRPRGEVAMATIMLVLSVGCGESPGSAEAVDYMPQLDIAVEVPGLAGCFGPITLQGDEPKRVFGSQLEYRYIGDGAYRVLIDGQEAGKAQFVPTGGIAHYSSANPKRTNGAIGTTLEFDSTTSMRKYIAEAYEAHVANDDFESIQLMLLALHSDVFGSLDSKPSSFGYYVFSYASPGILLAVRVDFADSSIVAFAESQGVASTVSKSSESDDESLFAFLKSIGETEAGTAGDGSDMHAYARLQPDCDSGVSQSATRLPSTPAVEQQQTSSGLPSSDTAGGIRPQSRTPEAKAPRRLYADGLDAYGYGDYPSARGLFVRACDGGSIVACRYAGMMLSMGRGGPQDSAGARELYDRACKGGDSTGCYYLTSPPERNNDDQ